MGGDGLAAKCVFASGVLVDGWMDGEVLINVDVRVEISRPTLLGF